MTKEEILKVCEECEMSPQGATMVNEVWLVNDDGDMIAPDYGYPIYSYQIPATYWIAHMARKKWCDMGLFIQSYMMALAKKGVMETEYFMDFQKDTQRIRPAEFVKFQKARTPEYEYD